MPILAVALVAAGLVVVTSTASGAADETRMTFVNNAGETLWIGSTVNADGSRELGGMPTLAPGASATIAIPDSASPAHWRGKFFARQRCSGEPGSTFHCLVGDCGVYPDRCAVGEQPASLAEFNFDRNDGHAPWYDVSYVNAVSLEITIETPGVEGRSPAGTCAVDCLGGRMLAACPQAHAAYDPRTGDRVVCVNPNRDAETDYTAALGAFGPRAYLWSTHDRVPGNETVYNCARCTDFVVTFHGKRAQLQPAPQPTTEPATDDSGGPTDSQDPALSTPMSTNTGTPLSPATRATFTETQARSPMLRLARFTELLDLSLNGSATIADGRLDLASGPWDGGSAWASNRTSTSRSWGTAFAFEISDVADGIAFVLQADGPDALGGYGGGLGYGHDNDRGTRIAPSLAIEFDAWSNSPDGYDPATAHIGVTVDGDMTQHLAAADPGFSLHSRGYVFAWISYDASSRTLRVWASQSPTRPLQQPLLALPIDLAAHFGSEPVYVGFTGSTGRILGTDPRASVLTWTMRVD